MTMSRRIIWSMSASLRGMIIQVTKSNLEKEAVEKYSVFIFMANELLSLICQKQATPRFDLE